MFYAMKNPDKDFIRREAAGFALMAFLLTLLRCPLFAFAGDTLRPSIEGVQSGLEEDLTGRKPNVNLPRVRQIESALNRNPRVASLGAAVVRQLAEMIARQRPFGGYQSADDLVRRLQGRVSGVSVGQIREAAATFRMGMSRRRFLAASALTASAAVVSAGAGVWLFPPSRSEEKPALKKFNGPGRVTWIKTFHIKPVDFDPALEHLKQSEGPKVLLAEAAVIPPPGVSLFPPPPLRAIRREKQAHLDLIRLLREEGPEAYRANRHGRVFSDHLESKKAELKRQVPVWRSDPSRAPELVRRELEYLAAHPEIDLELEDMPLEAFLYAVVAALSDLEAAAALLRDADEDAFHQAMAEKSHYQIYSGDLRDRAMRGVSVPMILGRKPGANITGQMGAAHFGEENPYGREYREAGISEEVRPIDDVPLPEKRIFEGLRRFGWGENCPIPNEIKEDFLRVFLVKSLSATLRNESTRSADEETLAARVILDLSMEEVRSIVRALQARYPATQAYILRRPQEERLFENWKGGVLGSVILGWLYDHRKVTPALEAGLRPQLRNITLDRVDRSLGGGLEEGIMESATFDLNV